MPIQGTDILQMWVMKKCLSLAKINGTLTSQNVWREKGFLLKYNI